MEDRFQHYQEMLKAKAFELKPAVEGLDEPLPPHDSIDIANGRMHKEMMAQFQDARTTILRLISQALRRITDGTYGVCLGCEQEIAPRRLEAVPWTPFCLACQEAYDHSRPVESESDQESSAAA